jgi:hypothetical protein
MSESPNLLPRRSLKVDFDELALALDDASGEAAYFLDLETGEVVVVTDDIRRAYEKLCASVG